MKKRVVVFIILIVILMETITPAISFAAKNNTTENALIPNNKDISIKGNGTIGTLLTEELNQESDNENSSIYGIVDVEMNANIATVEYYTKSDAIIIVAIYNEDKKTLITSESAKILASEEKTNLEFPVERIPEYYYLQAFMVDENNTPLCKHFSTTLYTEGIQKVAQMTAYDFEQERILNFDDDQNTNFAVYSEDTIVIKENESKMELVSVDEENCVYVFDNIDDSIRNLQEDQTLVYETASSEEIVIKISNISINETRAEIKGEKIELEDIFDYIKIETMSSNMATEVNEVDDESIKFEGLEIENEDRQSEQATITSEKKESSNTIGTKASFSFMDTRLGGDDLNIKLSGDIEFGFSITTDYYFNIWEIDNTFFSIKEKVNLSGNISVSGNIKVPALTFANINLKFPKKEKNPLIEIKFRPGLVIEASSEFSCSFTLESSSSQKATIDGISYTSTPIKLKTEDLLKNEVKVFIGFDISPKIEANMSKKKQNGETNKSSISLSLSLRARCGI